MKKDFKTYKIQQGDSLESIAQQWGWDMYDFKDFHNGRCGKDNFIHFNSIAFIDELCVPVHTKKEIQAIQNTYKPSKHFSPEFLGNKFKIQETLIKPEQDKLIFTYDLELHFSKKEDSKPWIVAVTKNNYKRNFVKPTTKISSRSIKTFESIQPIAYEINDNGQLKKLHNPQKLTEKFNRERARLEEYYTGEENIKFFNAFEKSLKNQKTINQKLTQTPLLYVLFPNLEWFWKEAGTTWHEDIVLLHNLKKAMGHFRIEQDFKPETQMKTTLKAYLHENKSLNELLTNSKINGTDKQRVEAGVKISYTTDKMTKKLLKINAKFVIDDYGGRQFFITAY